MNLYTSEGVKVLCGLDEEPFSNPLPPIPEYFWMDAQEYSSGIYKFDGDWVNLNNFEKHFKCKL